MSRIVGLQIKDEVKKSSKKKSPKKATKVVKEMGERNDK